MARSGKRHRGRRAIVSRLRRRTAEDISTRTLKQKYAAFREPSAPPESRARTSSFIGSWTTQTRASTSMRIDRVRELVRRLERAAIPGRDASPCHDRRAHVDASRSWRAAMHARPRRKLPEARTRSRPVWAGRFAIFRFPHGDACIRWAEGISAEPRERLRNRRDDPAGAYLRFRRTPTYGRFRASRSMDCIKRKTPSEPLLSGAAFLPQAVMQIRPALIAQQSDP